MHSTLTLTIRLSEPHGSAIEIHLADHRRTLNSWLYNLEIDWEEYSVDPQTGDDVVEHGIIPFGEWLRRGGMARSVGTFVANLRLWSQMLRANFWLPPIFHLFHEKKYDALKIETNLMFVPIHLLFTEDSEEEHRCILLQKIPHVYVELNDPLSSFIKPTPVPLSKTPKALVIVGPKRDGDLQDFTESAREISQAFERNFSAKSCIISSTELETSLFRDIELFAYVGHSLGPNDAEWSDRLPLGHKGKPLRGADIYDWLDDTKARIRFALLTTCSSFVPCWGERECGLAEAFLFAGANFVVCTQWNAMQRRAIPQMVEFAKRLKPSLLVANLHLDVDWEYGVDEHQVYEPSGVVVFSDGGSCVEQESAKMLEEGLE